MSIKQVPHLRSLPAFQFLWRQGFKKLGAYLDLSLPGAGLAIAAALWPRSRTAALPERDALLALALVLLLRCLLDTWDAAYYPLPFLFALCLAFGGMLLIVVPKISGSRHALLGDALGLGTAAFYAAYILVVARLRARHGTGIVMFASTLVFVVLLLPIALTQKFLPDNAHGWWLLAGCALSAQVLGQSLIAYALAHLPATFSAVGLYVQVIAAAGYAWLLLGERLTPLQMTGGVVVLAAIALARRTRSAALPAAAGALRAQQLRASIQSSAPRQSESR